MGKMILDAVCAIFGSGGSAKAYLSKWMTTVLSELLDAFNGNLLTGAMDIFAAIACSLLIIYFFMDLSNQASRDMFSFEKLIVAFIKFFVAFAVLLCLKEIMTGILGVGYKLFQMLEIQSIDIGSTPLTYNFDGLGVDGVTKENLYVGSEKYTLLLEKFEDKYSGIDAFFDHFGMLIPSFIMWLFSKVIQLAGYFLITSCALQIIIKGFISPIAVVQMFEDGTRSVGARHIKSFAAECITMAMMILVLTASEALSTLLYTASDGAIEETIEGVVNVSGQCIIHYGNLDDILTGEFFIKALLPQLAAIGGMMGAGKLSKEMIGA